MLNHTQRAPFVLALAKHLAGVLKAERHTEALFNATRNRIGGLRMTTIRIMLWNASQGLCVCCRQATELWVPASSANAATCGTLIPSAMVGRTEYRGGVLAGNCANFCRMCVNLSNNPVDHSQLWMWTADIIDAESVPLVWPSISKYRGVKPRIESNVDPVLWRRQCLRVMAGRGIAPLPH